MNPPSPLASEDIDDVDHVLEYVGRLLAADPADSSEVRHRIEQLREIVGVNLRPRSP